MAILTTLLIALLVLVCLLMVLIILMQRPKQEGLGAAFGGGMTDSMFGAQTTDVLQKGTTWLAVLFFSTTIALASIKTHEFQAAADKGEGLISNDPAEVDPALQPLMPNLNQPAFDPSIPLPGADGADTPTESDPATPAPIELLPPPSIIDGDSEAEKPATADKSKPETEAPAADDSADKKENAEPKPAAGEPASKPVNKPADPAPAPAPAPAVGE